MYVFCYNLAQMPLLISCVASVESRRCSGFSICRGRDEY